MKEKDCKIIRDLFPSYIDGLTSESTNEFILEHLKGCEECKKTLEDMKKEISLSTTKVDSKEVKYIKKFSNKMKILKIVLIVILLIFLISFVRKMIIVVSLNNKVSDYMSSTNYYIKTLSYAGERLNIIENYKKDDKYMRRYEILEDDSKAVAIDYYNKNIVNNYYELQRKEGNINEKVATLNEIGNPLLANISSHIPNPIKTDNIIEFLLTPLFLNITSEECNGIDCYRVVDMGNVYYIEKETGLTIRSIGGKAVSNDGTQYEMLADYQYKFDTVTDENFIEPDISEYEIQE